MIPLGFSFGQDSIICHPHLPFILPPPSPFFTFILLPLPSLFLLLLLLLLLLLFFISFFVFLSFQLYFISIFISFYRMPDFLLMCWFLGSQFGMWRGGSCLGWGSVGLSMEARSVSCHVTHYIYRSLVYLSITLRYSGLFGLVCNSPVQGQVVTLS
ncbi:hypothetical protein ACN42_g9551 [Penicillium freii]|uniref:Uncharacterized protein n=1 Tax=Penicillium freii TaxID=48697 RepID=A0A101MBS0_PENFR|nr:hypothetical protein ACN42_g9551 [Penicillium freii]